MTRSIAALAALLLAAPLAAQSDSAPPRIQAVAIGRALVAADLARISLSVVTRGPTSARAAAANADAQSSLRALLRGAGVADRDLVTPGYRVDDVRERDRRERPSATPPEPPYMAICYVTIRVTDLSRVGRLVDVAVSVGGVTVNDVEFQVAHPDSARRAAIDDAVRAARADAEAIARALGGRLGPVATVVTSPPRSFEGGHFSGPPAAFEHVSTAFSPPPVSVDAEVVASWVFTRSP